MKKENKLKVVLAVLLITIVQGGFAQDPDGAYWVIEGNLQNPTYTLIHYYNAQHQLIKDERLKCKYLDITKRKNVKRLNKKLNALTNSKTKGKVILKNEEVAQNKETAS
jgi:hypothetical protein